MPGGPYKHKSGSYYIIWRAAKLYPDQPRVSEQLRTKSKKEAQKRMHRLEELWEVGKHNPWESRWYDNESIKGFVAGNLLHDDISQIRQPGQALTMIEASEQYIAHQISRPRGWTSQRTIDNYSQTIRLLVEYIGPERYISSLKSEDFYRAIYRRTVSSEETMRSDRSRLIAMLNWFRKKDWIDKVPEIESPPPQEKVPKYFTDLDFLQTCWHKIAQVEQAIRDGYIRDEASPNQLRFVLAWMLMAGTGMRPAEATHLRLVDVHGDSILVGAHHRTKTNKQRVVPILYEAQSAISVLTDPAYRKKDAALRSTDSLLGIESDMVRKRMSAELRDSYKSIDGKGKRTAYNLRDYFAVRFLSDPGQGNQDFRLLRLRNILGHASVTTTEKYLKALPVRLDLSIPKGTDLVEILSVISAKVRKTSVQKSVSD